MLGEVIPILSLLEKTLTIMCLSLLLELLPVVWALTIPISLLTTLCRIFLAILIQSSSFTHGTPTIIRLSFLGKLCSSFNLLVCDWIVDSSIVNFS